MIEPHLQYLSYVLRHKYWVLWAGLRLGVPIRQLLVHDFSKFSLVEWFPYVSRFYGPKPPTLGSTGYLHKTGEDTAFDQAWEHHWRNNPHHWQYWSNDRETPDKMPMRYLTEMVADWIGAGLTQGKPDIQGWWEANKNKIKLDPETRLHVELVLTYWVNVASQV